MSDQRSPLVSDPGPDFWHPTGRPRHRDGCITNAAFGGEVAGGSPVDRGKLIRSFEGFEGVVLFARPE